MKCAGCAKRRMAHRVLNKINGLTGCAIWVCGMQNGTPKKVNKINGVPVCRVCHPKGVTVFRHTHGATPQRGYVGGSNRKQKKEKKNAPSTQSTGRSTG